MTYILPLNRLRQDGPNSCWASCTRMLVRYYLNQSYTSDAALAAAVGLSERISQNIVTALQHFHLDDQPDAANLPTLAEIKAELKTNRRPLVACVSTTPVAANANVFNGHYILIVGYSTRLSTLTVIDPADGVQRTVPYDPTTYAAAYGRRFWGITYYTRRPASIVRGGHVLRARRARVGP